MLGGHPPPRRGISIVSSPHTWPPNAPCRSAPGTHPTPFIGALEREVGMTGSCPSILPRAHGKLGRRASLRPWPPGCRRSRGTRARGIVPALRALRVDLFPEEVLTPNTRACDGHACTCACRLRCSPEALQIICAGGGTLPSGWGVQRRAGLTPVSRRQAHACTCSCTQMLGAGPACWEDFPGSEPSAAPESAPALGTPTRVETYVAGIVLRALPAGLLNPTVPREEEPTSIFIPIL